MTPAHHVVLVGMMGTGKTTVGRALAERLHRPFLDSDAVIEARTSRTVAQIFADEGESAFRALESEVLTDALDAPEPGVVAAAGGSVLDPATRARLAEAGTVVWLRASPQVLAVRVRGAGHRPLLDRDPDGTLARLSEQRAPLYRSVADLVIDVDDAPVDVVVDRILSALTAREAS